MAIGKELGGLGRKADLDLELQCTSIYVDAVRVGHRVNFQKNVEAVKKRSGKCGSTGIIPGIAVFWHV